MQETGSG